MALREDRGVMASTSRDLSVACASVGCTLIRFSILRFVLHFEHVHDLDSVLVNEVSIQGGMKMIRVSRKRHWQPHQLVRNSCSSTQTRKKLLSSSRTRASTEQEPPF